MQQSVTIPVVESADVGTARRMATRLAEKLGFIDTDVGRAGLVVTEAATNLIKHAGRGQLLIRTLPGRASQGLEVLSLDRGQGIRDLKLCLRDGYSTAGSPGTGLGAIVRLSNLFDIYSNPGCGTALVARVFPTATTRQEEHRLEEGVVCVSKEGEEVCGDGWWIHQERTRSLIMLADGLGHGSFAFSAATEAIRVFRENVARSPAQIIEAMHGPLRSTRGAAVAVAEINFPASIVRYAGVGNIAATVASGGATRSLVSHNGTVGHELLRSQEFTYPWPAGALLLMHSDGLQTRWTLANYPGLAARHPALLAGVLYRDFQRGRDDATMVVVREPMNAGVAPA